MVQKIQSSEYLKRLDNMTSSEKDDYFNSAEEWLDKSAPVLLSEAEKPSAVFQNVIQVSMSWNENICRAWSEGARLLTALTSEGDTWLPDMLYTKSAKRSIRLMYGLIRKVFTKHTEAVVATDVVDDKPEGMSGDGKNAFIEEYTRKVVEAHSLQPVSVVTLPSGDKPEIVRPKHIDQYIHLLPKETQEHALLVQPLLRDMDVARENVRLLMDSPSSDSESRAMWAKKVTGIDNKLKSIYSEIDSEWDKLVKQGKVTVDDLGNAHVVPDAEATDTEGKTDSPDAEPAEPEQKTEVVVKADEVTLQEFDAKRMEYLKRWLRETRIKPSPERKEQWEKNCQELLKLGGEVTDSIRKAADVYGVDVDKLQSNCKATDEAKQS